jgi:hypothetical protein
MPSDCVALSVTEGQLHMTMDSQPIACTLASDEFRRRRAWIADLARDALRDNRREDLVLRLHYLPEAAARVREMVRMESQCCAFLTFETHERRDGVLLTITAPEAAREAAAAMFDWFATPAGTGPTCCLD